MTARNTTLTITERIHSEQKPPAAAPKQASQGQSLKASMLPFSKVTASALEAILKEGFELHLSAEESEKLAADFKRDSFHKPLTTESDLKAAQAHFLKSRQTDNSEPSSDIGKDDLRSNEDSEAKKETFGHLTMRYYVYYFHKFASQPLYKQFQKLITLIHNAPFLKKEIEQDATGTPGNPAYELQNARREARQARKAAEDKNDLQLHLRALFAFPEIDIFPLTSSIFQIAYARTDEEYLKNTLMAAKLAALGKLMKRLVAHDDVATAEAYLLLNRPKELFSAREIAQSEAILNDENFLKMRRGEMSFEDLLKVMHFNPRKPEQSAGDFKAETSTVTKTL
jgi:hypothetical protein